MTTEVKANIPSLGDLAHEMIRSLSDDQKMLLVKYLDYADGEKTLRLMEEVIYDYVDEDDCHSSLTLRFSK